MRRTLVALAVLALSLPPVLAGAKGKPHPDATLKLSGRSVAAGVGVTWGSGTLSYKGKSYPISVTGLDVGSVGAAEINATGNVYNLKKLEDFDGTYAAVEAEAAVGGGGAALVMKNQNGARVTLTSTTRGVKVTVGTGGVKMEVKK